MLFEYIFECFNVFTEVNLTGLRINFSSVGSNYDLLAELAEYQNFHIFFANAKGISNKYEKILDIILSFYVSFMQPILINIKLDPKIFQI